jgi:DNA-binding protein H-NS
MEKTLQRDQARELFLQTELSNTQIADHLGVDRKTVSRWIKEEQWREMKHVATQAPAAILLELYDQLTALNRNISSRESHLRFPTKEEALIQRRMLLSIKSIDRQHPGNYMQTYSELLEEIGEADKDLAKEIAKYADSIIKRKNKKDKRFNTLQHMFINDEILEGRSESAESGMSLACPTLGVKGEDVKGNVSASNNGAHNACPADQSGDIEKNAITQQDQLSPQNISTSMSHKNLADDGTLIDKTRSLNSQTAHEYNHQLESQIVSEADKKEKELQKKIEYWNSLGYEKPTGDDPWNYFAQKRINNVVVRYARKPWRDQDMIDYFDNLWLEERHREKAFNRVIYKFTHTRS